MSPATTETPTLQSFIRDVIATGENDPAKIAAKALHNTLGHSDAETILFHAVYQVAKEEYRTHVRTLSWKMVADNTGVVTNPGERPTGPVRLRSQMSAKGATKPSQSRDEWLGETTWFPDVDRYVPNGEASARNWDSRARYLHDQLLSHQKTVNLEITIDYAAGRLIRAHHVKCLNDVPGFTKDMLAGDNE